jgi:formylglycine-generating enzyme required for sulfatase activity
MEASMLPPPDAKIPAGAFRMGAAEGRPDERPVHEVEVGAFRIALTPVTRAQYAPFIQDTGAAPPPWWSDPAFAAADQPVVGVTWFEAEQYAEWLSQRFAGRWRLPTEAEWERAARGGLDQAATAWGDAVPTGEVPQGELRAPWPVARGAPNGFGLFDAGTIVHEWCADWYSPEYYVVAPHHDPRGPDEGERRSSRGGSWRHHVRWSPPGARSSLPPAFRYSDYGFHLVREE